MLCDAFDEVTFSSVYETAPQEVEDQPAFLNAVARCEIDCSPEEMLKALQKIEQVLHKNITERYGPRTIDLDILLMNGVVTEDPAMTIPHPRMHERRFVLEPLLELVDGESLHPVQQESWSDLLAKTLKQSCDRTDLTL
jgi:2-amino-4-hydroxy-6-hydroxymethyldihydropteridine diphosphokinase